VKILISKIKTAELQSDHVAYIHSSYSVNTNYGQVDKYHIKQSVFIVTKILYFGRILLKKISYDLLLSNPLSHMRSHTKESIELKIWMCSKNILELSKS
jgi:hypothetical protein